MWRGKRGGFKKNGGYCVGNENTHAKNSGKKERLQREREKCRRTLKAWCFSGKLREKDPG